MKYQYVKKIGKASITFYDDAKNHEDFFQKISFYMLLPEKCGNCGSEDLVCLYRSPKGYDYYSIGCNNCKHEFKLGQAKDEKGRLFPKSWEPPHNGNGKSERPARKEKQDRQYEDDFDPSWPE